MKAIRSIVLWGLISAVGAISFIFIALKRGESINAYVVSCGSIVCLRSRL